MFLTPLVLSSFLSPFPPPSLIFFNPSLPPSLLLPPQDRRGVQQELLYIDLSRVLLKYVLPLSEIVVDYDQSKSCRWEGKDRGREGGAGGCTCTYVYASTMHSTQCTLYIHVRKGLTCTCTCKNNNSYLHVLMYM